jgi:WD40 repeat protein
MIRLLPRTPRGTWLLAGAFWLAATTVLWFVLPVLPRTTWALPEPSKLLGFAAGEKTLLTSSFGIKQLVCFGEPSIWTGAPRGPVRYWEVATGRESRPAWQGTEFFDDCRVSPAGHVVRMTGASVPWPAVHFPLDGPVLQLPAQEAELPALPPVPAADRWLVYSPTNNTDAVRVWDLHTRRHAGTLPEGDFPTYRSADGTFVVTYCTQQKAMRVWNLDTLRVVAAVPRQGPTGLPLETALSADARVLALKEFAGNIREGRCYDTASGELRLRAPDIDEMVITPDGRTLITSKWATTLGIGEMSLIVWDVAGGRSRAECIVTVNDQYHYSIRDSLSPDGRWLAVSLDGMGTHPLNRMAAWFGLSPPFAERPHLCAGILDVRSGRWAGELPACVGSVAWGHDGRTLATVDPSAKEVQIWDIPVRKPRSWLAAGAALLAAVPFLMAPWQVGRLRRQSGNKRAHSSIR